MGSSDARSKSKSEESTNLLDTPLCQNSSESNQNDDVIIKEDTISNKTKRVSFNFGSHRASGPIISTIQNIYDPNSNYNRNRISNKAAYFKLHRHSFSPGSNPTVEKLKGKYEHVSAQTQNGLKGYTTTATISPTTTFNSKTQNLTGELEKSSTKDSTGTPSHVEIQSSLSNKLTPDNIEKLRQKYSPKNFGYPKTNLSLPPSRIPVPTPRASLTKQSIKLETVKVKEATIDKAEDIKKIPVITEITPNNFEEVQLIYNTIKFAEPEDKHFIVTRSSSEDSILKLENSLADFIMEKKPKEKKRSSSSFRRMLTTGLFGRDKKKEEEEKLKPKKKDNAAFADNAQNESQVFDRHSSQRHTVDSSYPRHAMQKKQSFQRHTNSGQLYYYKPQLQHGNIHLDNRYTEMKGNNIMQHRHPNCTPEEYVQMDNGKQTSYLNVSKFIDTSSSSSNTLDSESRNCTYQNALVAQAELRHIRYNENRINSLQTGIFQENFSDSSSSSEILKNVPSRNQKTRNVELVKPKALIPINSERPLPNPYHNGRENSMPYENIETKTIERNLDVETMKPIPNKNNIYQRVKSPINVVIEDVYGTVFDSISCVNDQKRKSPICVNQLSPKSLEGSKLKLPPNREKVELQPRIRSPIPQNKVSTDKIIATELLRNKGSPTRSPIGSVERQHVQKVPKTIYVNQEIISPNAHSNEYIHLNTVTSFATNKPPPSPRESPRMIETCRRQKDSQHVILATVHADINDSMHNPIQQRYRSPSPHRQLNGAFIPAKTNKEIYSYQNHSDSSTHSGSGSTYRMQSHSSGDHEIIQEDSYGSRTAYAEHGSSPLSIYRQTSNSPLHANSNESICRNSDILGVKACVLPKSIQNNTVAQQYNHPYRTSSPNSDVPKRYVLPRNMQVNTEVQQYHHQQQMISPNSDPLYGSLQQIRNVSNNRPHTPVGQSSLHSQQQKSPVKQHMFQNVEAFYWRELKKLKDKEEQDLLNYRQQQFHVYGYVEDPVLLRRSRSVSPTMQRGRRSLSLPRDVRATTGRTGPETIPEGRPIIDKKPISLPNRCDELDYGQIRQQFQRNPNFVRNTFERTTIGPIGRSRYNENYQQSVQPPIPPIFKRGSLTSDANSSNEQLQTNKKVSFSNSAYPSNPTSWPTKNGFTQSPPTRRVEREVALEDDVFLPNSARNIQHGHIENIYTNDIGPTSYKNGALPPKGISKSDHVQRASEPVYESASPKQITVSNKVCDIYGQIHDLRRPNGGQMQTTPLPSPHNYGQIRQVGFVYGRIQQTPGQSPVVMRQSFDHLNMHHPNFIRGTRLTASVNDMYRRYPVNSSQHVEFVRNTMQAPNRPLPPVPERKDSRHILTKKFIRSYQNSDAESGSEAGEVQQILYMGANQKNFGAIGK